MSTSDRFASAGINLDAATPEQQAVLASLSDDELAVITSVNNRLVAAGADVQAHTTVIGGVLF